MPNGLTPTSPMAVAFDPPLMTVIEVKGSEAAKVLNGLCTAKLVELAPGTATEAFFTDDRGRVITHVMVACDATSHWIVGQIAQPAAAVTHIDRFIFREDATPRDVTAQYRCCLLLGLPQSLAQLSGMSADVFTQFGWHRSNIGNIEARWLRLPMIERPLAGDTESMQRTSWLCLVPREQADEFERQLVREGCVVMTPDELETARIAAFWPQIGKEIHERTLPQELDRNRQAISFTKGCYLGQETVARLDAMGEVQRKLCLVAFDGSENLESVSSLARDGKEIGKITSLAPLPLDGTRHALAYMRRGHFAVETSFEADTGAGIVHGRVVAHGSPSLGTPAG